MTRYTFGGEATSLVAGIDIDGKLVPSPGVQMQFYTVETGGTVSTDYLLDPGNDGVFELGATSVTTREDGYLPKFKGPDGVYRLYYDPDPTDSTTARVHLDAWDYAPAGGPPAATTSTPGIVELATTTEVTTGTDTTRAVTPEGAAAAIAAHAAASNPHPQYVLAAGLSGALAAKADLVSGLVPISQLPGVQAATASTLVQRRSGGTVAGATAAADDDLVTLAQMTAAIAGVGGGVSANPRGVIRVASSQATAAVKAQCDYVCDGTDDQVQINLALKDASRSADGFSGLNAGCVELVGGDFFTSHDGATAITMYPATWLRGSGFGTVIQPRWPTNVDRGAIELLNANVDHVTISDLSILRPNAVAFNGTGIKLQQNAASTVYSIDSGSDPFICINDVFIGKANRYGVHLLGAASASGCRESQLFGVHVFGADLGGFVIDSSDCKLTGCTAQAGAGSGFIISGGNAKLSNCKSYYSDNHGFECTSSRTELNGCAAQDNGLFGFYMSSNDATVVGCVADSNQRLDAAGTAGGGFRIASSGCYEGLNCFDRAQSTNRQVRGIVMSGTPSNTMLTGRVSLPSGTSHVVGTLGANSYARVVRSGAALFTVG